MLSLSEDLLFVWEPSDLVMSWYTPRLPKWVEGDIYLSKKSVVMGQKIMISERGCIIGWITFLEGASIENK